MCHVRRSRSDFSRLLPPTSVDTIRSKNLLTKTGNWVAGKKIHTGLVFSVDIRFGQPMCSCQFYLLSKYFHGSFIHNFIVSTLFQCINIIFLINICFLEYFEFNELIILCRTYCVSFCLCYSQCV